MFGSPNPFGQTSSSPFGLSGFGQTAAPTNNPFAPKPFGSPTPFGSQIGNSVFGGTSTGMSGAPRNSSPFPSTTTFGASSFPAFGSSMPAFGASSTPAFNISSSPFGGTQETTPTFASLSFGPAPLIAQQGGSRAVPYTATADTEIIGARMQAGKLESVSAMPVYKEKSHEELRYEDYQLGEKGGSLPSSRQPGPISFRPPTAQSNPFGPSSTSARSSANPFSSSTPSNPFAPNAFAPSATSAFSSSPFSVPLAANPFQSTSFPSSSSGELASTSPSLFGPSSSFSFSVPTAANPFQSTSFPSSSSGGFASTSPSLFGPSSSSSFASRPSLFTSTAQGTSSAFSTTPALLLQGPNSSIFSSRPSLFTPTQRATSAIDPTLSFPNSYPSTLFQSTTPWLAQTGSLFGPTTSSFGPNSSSPFGPSNAFNTPATSLQGSLFSSSPSLFSSTNPVSTAARPFQQHQCSGCQSRGGASLFPDTSGQNSLSASAGFGTAPFGSRAVPYTASNSTEWDKEQLQKLASISAMAAYQEKSHEELRLDDYQWGDKGGPNPSGQALGELASTVDSNPVGPSSSTFAQTSANPSSPSSTPANQSSAPSVAICMVFVNCSLN